MPVLRVWIITTLCSLLLLLGGCSALRIGYGTAPDLVYWWLDRYVDFDGAQPSRVREALAQWFAWHRRTQLPEYAALLARARAEVVADVTPARVCEWNAEALRRVDTALDRALPAAAEIVLTLTPAQLVQLERRYAKVNDEFRDDYLQPDPARRAAAALKRTVERAEMLYGALGTEQRERLASALARSPFDAERWLVERRARQQDVLQTLGRVLRDRPSREQVQLALRGLVDRVQRSPHEPYRRYSEQLLAYNCGVAATLHNTTTLAQRSAAAKTLAGWEGDLRALAAATPTAAPD